MDMPAARPVDRTDGEGKALDKRRQRKGDDAGADKRQNQM